MSESPRILSANKYTQYLNEFCEKTEQYNPLHGFNLIKPNSIILLVSKTLCLDKLLVKLSPSGYHSIEPHLIDKLQIKSFDCIILEDLNVNLIPKLTGLLAPQGKMLL